MAPHDLVAPALAWCLALQQVTVQGGPPQAEQILALSTLARLLLLSGTQEAGRLLWLQVP